MTRFITTTAVLLLASVIPCQAAKVEWRGAAMLVTATTACGTEYMVGQAIPIRYRPSGLGDNGTKSSIAFHQNFYGQAFPVDGRFTTNTLTSVAAGQVGANWGAFTNQAKVNIFGISPASYNETTVTLSIFGLIQNFGDVSGCNVSFRSAVSLKP